MSDIHSQQTTPPAPPPSPGPGSDLHSRPAPAPSPTVITADPNAPAPPPEKPYWPDDWKQKVAEHVSAGDKARMEKELKRLETMDSPVTAWSRFREMENTWASRQFVRLPGKEAKPEDLSEFHKALGVPEKPEDYFKDIKLSNGAVLGEADKPIADAFAAAVHKAGATPAMVSAAMDWYFTSQQQAAEKIDEADDTFHVESEKLLKQEIGPAYKRKIGAISSLFSTAPGGTDINNAKSLYSRLMGGRTADGKIIGDDPDMVRWMMGLGLEINPSASVVEDGDQTGKSVDSEIAEIEKVMRTDRRRYDKELAPRYTQLLEARDKIRARAR